MSDKLTVWTAAKEVSTAVGTMVNTYKTLRTVKKQESIMVSYFQGAGLWELYTLKDIYGISYR